MRRILVLGNCPLPFEDTVANFAPGRRTWQFALPLKQAGHDVRIAALRTPFVYPPTLQDVEQSQHEGIEILNIEEHVFLQDAFLQDLCRAYRPDALVGANIYGGVAAARLPFDLPRWVDVNGHTMAEAQAKAKLDQSDEVLPYFWGMVRDALQYADRLSVASRFQRYAVIGELGALGRLNHRTAGIDLVEQVPIALDPREIPRPSLPLLRGQRVPQDAFIVQWSGGYNVWADTDTLFQALERAMDRDPRIWFVSTGGAIRGHDQTTYQDFSTRVQNSRHAARFLLEGWLPRSVAEAYPFEADVGIVLDRFLYEGLLGCKNRVLEWMRYALPAICSDLGEVAAVVREAAIGWVVPLADPNAVAELLVSLANNRALVRERGAAARAYGAEQCTYQATTAALQRWAQQPSFAPDHLSNEP
jgi:glycosyltransferase involved in cell wall biosynthesis